MGLDIRGAAFHGNPRFFISACRGIRAHSVNEVGSRPTRFNSRSLIAAYRAVNRSRTCSGSILVIGLSAPRTRSFSACVFLNSSSHYSQPQLAFKRIIVPIPVQQFMSFTQAKR